MKDKLMDIIQKMLNAVVEDDLSDPVAVKHVVNLANEFIETVED
jgi:hypothetical protein